jgi:hypothetical protein
MSELFDTSRIPDDPQYWESLAERTAAHAIRQGRESSLGWFAYSRASRVAAMLAVAAALVVAVTDRTGNAHTPAPDWTAALSPTDELGKALALSLEPPAIDGLLFGSSTPARGTR